MCMACNKSLDGADNPVLCNDCDWEIGRDVADFRSSHKEDPTVYTSDHVATIVHKVALEVFGA